MLWTKLLIFLIAFTVVLKNATTVFTRRARPIGGERCVFNWGCRRNPILLKVLHIVVESHGILLAMFI